MGFDAALRAAHDGCSLGNVQLFPVTQQKRLALTRWQPLQLFFNYFNDLRLPKLIFGGAPRPGGGRAPHDLEAAALSRVSSGSASSSSRPGERAENSVTHRDRTLCLR